MYLSARCLYPCRMTNSLVYYGISINTSNLVGSLYLNFIISVVVEIPSLLLAFALLDRLGRRPVYIGFIIFSGAACFSIAFVPSGNQTKCPFYPIGSTQQTMTRDSLLSPMPHSASLKVPKESRHTVWRSFIRSSARSVLKLSMLCIGGSRIL